ncbi:MAG: hypothetical protein GC162_12105 [Planctomycetes bacterium]|nr:hypothetical protein [Planctomycetota bacterium]
MPDRFHFPALVAVLCLAPFAFAADIAQNIGVIPGALKYNVTRFDAHPGDRVTLTFTNNGLMPHNLVLAAQPDSAEALLAAATAIAADGYERSFVPDTPLVLTATKLLDVKKSQTLKFTAPDTPGEYTYMCTFPGHGIIMRGVLRVRPAGEALQPPQMIADALVQAADAMADSTVTPRPMGSVEHPYVIRTFMPSLGLDATVLEHHDRGYPSPHYNVKEGHDVEGEYQPIDGLVATITVNFGKRLSYVWDTIDCRLVYAWKDGFMDMTDYWGAGAGGGRRSFAYLPHLEGTLVFKAAGSMPLSIGDSEQQVAPKFKGYRLLAGTPQFMFALGSTQVSEQIVPGEGGTIAMHYHVDAAPGDVHMTFDPSIRKRVTADKGDWKDDTLTIPAKDAGHFVVMIKEQALESFEPFELPGYEAKKLGDVFAAVERKSQSRGTPEVADKLAPGEKIFLDRDYKFAELPDELRGVEFIRGFNNDAKGRAAYELKFDKPAVVYLLLDQRVARVPQHKKMKLEKTGKIVKTSGDWTYDLYRAEVEPGTYTIDAQSGGSMYVLAAGKP